MRRILKAVVFIAAAVCIMFGAAVLYGMFKTDRTLGTADTSVSPDGSKTLELLTEKEPSVFGKAKAVIVFSGAGAAQRWEAEVDNQGDPLTAANWDVSWLPDRALVILSGAGQNDTAITVRYAGSAISDPDAGLLQEGEEADPAIRGAMASVQSYLLREGILAGASGDADMTLRTGRTKEGIPIAYVCTDTVTDDTGTSRIRRWTLEYVRNVSAQAEFVCKTETLQSDGSVASSKIIGYYLADLASGAVIDEHTVTVH